MARQLEMPRQQWINYETGKNAPGAEVLAKICRAHACSADWLLGLNNPKSTAVDFGPVKASSGGIAIGGVGNRVSVTIVALGDVGHASMCRSCPYRKWGEKLRKQGLVIPGVDGK